MRLENITIGSCLSSVLFAYYNKYPLIINSEQRPFIFDSFKEEVDFKGLSTNSHIRLWSWAVYEMSFGGSIPFGPCISSARIEKNKLFVVPNPGSRIEVEFEKCYIFDDNNISFENQAIKTPAPLYRVFDWMNVRAGAKHGVSKITTGDDLVREVYFYKSERMDGDHTKKDLVSVSYLTDDQINDFDYSDTMAKFKVESHMRTNGIGNERRSSIRVEPTRREMVNLNKNVFQNSETVKFLKMSKLLDMKLI